MSSDCIIVQTHIPDYDIHGRLTAMQKHDILSYSVALLRGGNKDAYIILTGHGMRPCPDTLDYCDFVYWENSCRPLSSAGIVDGMPAQYFFVSMGLKQAKAMGFERCLKTRGDCVIGKANICKYCDAVLDAEKKELLITQQTSGSSFQMGDCFMYGNTDLMDRIWDKNNPVLHSEDGLMNTGMNFYKTITGITPIKFNPKEWCGLLRKHCSFRDVRTLGYADIRWNYHNIDMKEDFNFKKWQWGKTNKWVVFDGLGNMTYMRHHFSERTFYGCG